MDALEAAGETLPVVMVGQVDGFPKPGENTLPAETRAALEARGVRIVTAAHTLSGAERGISRKFGGVYPVELVAHTLRMLGQGVKAVSYTHLDVYKRQASIRARSCSR